MSREKGPSSPLGDGVVHSLTACAPTIGCGCSCHRWPHVKHFVACCDAPPYKEPPVTEPLTGKVYLASRYSRHDEMQGVRTVLETLCGVTVTSRWIDLHGGSAPESRTADQLHADTQGSSVYAIHDLQDLMASDTVISFTDGSNSSKGGRHVEFGYALAEGKRIILVGPRENVFHTLPEVEWFPDWSRLVMALTHASSTGTKGSGVPGGEHV